MSRAPADRGWRCRDRGSDLHRTPDLRCRLRNERAAYERPRGTAVSRLGCRTRQPCRCIRHRHSPHTTSRSSRGRRAAGIRRARGLHRTLTMLRITDILDVTADCRETWTLRLEGTLKDEWVRELRRAWRRIREAAAGASIRVELADVPFVDPAGKVLLAEMYRDGVDIVATDCLGAAIRADIVDRSTRDRRAR